MSLTPLTSPFAKVELLEVSQTLKEELLARKRMSQTDGFGMQKEAPCSFVAVERIAHDGRMQSSPCAQCTRNWCVRPVLG